MNKSDRRGDRVGIVAPISASAIGSPVANRNGEIIGIVTTRNEQGEALDLVRPSSAVQSFISEVAPDATARWPEMAQTSPSPHPTPKPSPGLAGRGKSSNERRIVYKPQPNYPFEARSHAPETRTGRFQLHFDATGNVTAVQIVKSTGNDILDRASTKALEQWRSEPGQEWITTIPITFENR